MGIEQNLLEIIRDLPPEKQQAVLEFAEALKSKAGASQPRRSIKGICTDLGINISAEDIDEARREMWGNFPREDIG